MRNLTAILTLLLLGHDVFQEVDTDLLITWQIVPDIHCKQVVNLALAAVLGRELLGADLDHLILGWDLICGAFHAKENIFNQL